MADLYTYEELRNFVVNCERCPLSRGRTHAVMGKGPVTAKIMFVGEGPGRQEDQKGEPFVGPSGALFDKMLSEAGLSRKDVYITNIVKCRPPCNRDPEKDEQAVCMEYLKYETALVRPEMLVALGRVAAQRIIREDIKITREHGKVFERKGFKLMAMFHPAALLRDPGKVAETARDFEKIAEILGADK